jgi:N-methylhydantoinase A
VVSAYLSRLKSRLGEIGFRGDVRVMQSNGGLMSSDTAIQSPVHLLESGPAAGVVAAASIATRLGLGDVVTLDIGGTTAKSALVEKGRPALASEYEVGAPISIASRVIKGGGYVISTPVIDLAEVGAGGGSIVYTDSARGLHVGPRSAGASPGPVCYGRGGVEATLTDADVVLGLLPGSGLAGGEIPIDVAAARRVVAGIAKSHRVALLEMAHGIGELADAAMSRAVRAVSVSRGHDVRKATLIAFGGNGPVHAAAVAARLGIRHVLIPNAPGLFSAIGLVEAVIERHAAATVRVLLDGRSADTQIAGLFNRLDSETARAISSNRSGTGTVTLRRFADLRYQGQSAVLQLPLPAGGAKSVIPKIADAFHLAHESIYGHRFSDRRVELVSIRSVASVAAPAAALRFESSSPSRGRTRRSVYFGRHLGLVATPVLARSDLSARRRTRGPLLIDEYDSTAVVPPGASVLLDRDSNIHMELGLQAL